MKQFSIYLGSPFGIPTSIHWTFWILIIWIVYINASQGRGGEDTVWYVLFVFAIFACVVLHELGHALAARRYGIKTRSITILPIGGVASLEKIPENPREELVVAVAGPMVNVLIAILVGGLLSLTGNLDFSTEHLEGLANIGGSNFLLGLLLVNIMLVVFNMIPAFPMDGGRVLRAILAMRMSRFKATEWAVNIGKFFAILFVFWGFSSNPFLIFIALFIVISAQSELELVRSTYYLHDHTIKDILMKDFTLLEESEPLSEAVRVLLNGQEKQFLVTNGYKITGYLSKSDIIKGLTTHNEHILIKEIANPKISWAAPDEAIDVVRLRMMQQGMGIMPVGSPGSLEGIIDVDNINEFLMIQYATNKG